jgi:hypothetical protein
LTDTAPDEEKDVKSSGGPPGPNLVDSVTSWEALKVEALELMEKLAEVLTIAENVRIWLQTEYGVIVPALGPTGPYLITKVDETLATAGPLPPIAMDGPVRDYTPPPQGPIYTEPNTQPVDVDEIRKGAVIPGASRESMDSFTQRMLGSVNKTFLGG